MSRVQRQLSRFPFSPKQPSLQACLTVSQFLHWPEPRSLAQPWKSSLWVLPHCPVPCPLAFKEPLSEPECLSVKPCACVHALCVFQATGALTPAALYSNWWLKSLVFRHRVSEPSILASPGPEEPGKQSSGGGEGKDPLCCPSLLYWDEVCDLHPEVGWMEGKGSQEVVLVAGKS